MRRICVLGNSHAAAIALGWKEVRDRYAGTSLTFFALPRDRLGGLKVEGGALVPDTAELASQLGKMTGGDTRVNAESFDAFWLCGLGFGIRPSYAVFQNFWAEFEQSDVKRAPISNACLAATIAGALRRTLASKLATKLKRISDHSISIIPSPMASVAALEARDDERYEVLRRLVMDKHEDAFSTVLQRAYGMLGDGQIRVVLQPSVTLASPLLSHDRYSRGSVRLTAEFDQQHPAEDFEHMNALFGAKVIESQLGAYQGALSAAE